MREIRSLGLHKAAYRTLDVCPDDVDSRDHRFIPSLALLPEYVDPRVDRGRVILDQGTEGACVGFALAAVINASLSRRTRDCAPLAQAQDALPPRRLRGAKTGSSKQPVFRPKPEMLASPRMLYEMARRYDDWPGESYEGSTLRAAMKGWHHHGVCSQKNWPYEKGEPGYLDKDRAEEARSRPLGAYCRIADDDVSQMQAAVVEADAVLASAWVHSGWQGARLLQTSRTLDIVKIRPESRAMGLHAFAIVGYCPEGFILQNSWGEAWGTGGLAILSYEDWMENRQDAWVARPGPETWDQKGSPRIFLDGFLGAAPGAVTARAGTSGADGLEIDSRALAYLVNTGDRGELSHSGRLETPEEDLPVMASRARLARISPDGCRDIVLYAHGGLNSELAGAQRAAELWSFCRNLGLTAWFFVWETGIGETLLGYLRSRNDGSGPAVSRTMGSMLSELGLEDAAHRAESKRITELVDKLQEGLGAGLAPLVRRGWNEMHGRALGAARLPAKGGAALFANQLLQTISEGGPGERYRIHLVAHSAGAIYLAQLYQQFLRGAIASLRGRVALGSIALMAPALSIARARKVFAPEGRLPVPPDRFTVWTLSPEHESSDEIGIYPASLLTYVADHLERSRGREPLLGIRKDFERAAASLGGPTHCPASVSVRHGEFDDPGHEVETIFTQIAGAASTSEQPGRRHRARTPIPVAAASHRGDPRRLEGRM